MALPESSLSFKYLFTVQSSVPSVPTVFKRSSSVLGIRNMLGPERHFPTFFCRKSLYDISLHGINKTKLFGLTRPKTRLYSSYSRKRRVTIYITDLDSDLLWRDVHGLQSVTKETRQIKPHTGDWSFIDLSFVLVWSSAMDKEKGGSFMWLLRFRFDTF